MKEFAFALPDRNGPSGRWLARSVLGDMSSCLAWLRDEEDPFRFRMVLLTSIVLVRAVGHVLQKVDGKGDQLLAKIVRNRYDTWAHDKSETRIFWDFIESERNNLLKEYEFRFDFDPAITTGSGDGGWKIGADLYCPIVEGPYAGEDVRDVLEEALQWWVKEFNVIAAEYESQLG